MFNLYVEEIRAYLQARQKICLTHIKLCKAKIVGAPIIKPEQGIIPKTVKEYASKKSKKRRPQKMWKKVEAKETVIAPYNVDNNEDKEND